MTNYDERRRDLTSSDFFETSSQKFDEILKIALRRGILL